MNTNKLVIVTRKTQVEELVARFNSRDQARFYIEQNVGKGRFKLYQEADVAYREGVENVHDFLPRGVPTQWIDRELLPTFSFGRDDIVVTIGPDGLVVNTAKYLDGQPLVAINPDPSRIDGVLLPFDMRTGRVGIEKALAGGDCWDVTMAEATLNDGQSIRAVNDLFIGQRTHVSARYRLKFEGNTENQSSSGIIVSTGAGSTGWLRSIVAGARAIAGVEDKSEPRFDWDARQLVFNVREPFESRTSTARIVCGTINDDTPLEIISHMPQNGVIFSDGVEEDFLQFNSGSVARIGLAARTLRLVKAD